MAAVPFTPQELEMPVKDALSNEDLRVRLAQHIAAARGISTGAALKLVENTAAFELKPTTSLGTVLSHMDHPNFNLDASLATVFARANRPFLHRVVTALMLDQGINDEWEAIQQLHAGADAEGSGSTLRAALEWTRSDPEDVGETLRLFEQRDETVRRTLDQAMSADPQLKRSPDGLVLLDQGASGAAASAGMDAATALSDPAEAERRWARACRVDARWRGDDGHKQFLEEDRDRLVVGQDMVRTLEGNEVRRAAEQKAAQAGAQLDRVIRAAAPKRARARALEAEIAKLGAERAKLAEEAAVPAREERKLKLLDGSQESRITLLSTVLQIRVSELLKAQPDLTYQECLRRVLEAAEDGCPLTQAEEGEQWRRGIYYALDQGQDPEPAPAPANPSAEMHQRVVERMRQLDRPEGEYVRTAEELLGEDARGLA